MTSYWNYGEVFFIVFLFFKIISTPQKIVFNLKKAIIALVFVVIVLIQSYFTGFDVIKVSLIIFYAYAAYIFPRYTLKLYLYIYFSVLLLNVFFQDFSKANQFDFVFISALFFVLKGKFEFNKQVVIFFIVVFLLEFLQSYLFSSRSHLLYAFLALIYFIFPFIRNMYVKAFPYFPFAYILIMTFYYIYAIELGLPITISNVERSSMIYWCVSNLQEFLIFGPGADAFIEGSKNSMFSGFHRITPNDPHSVFLFCFVTLGSVLTLILVAFYLHFLSKFKVLSFSPILMSIYLYLVLLLSVATFTSDTRIALGLSIGVLYYFSKSVKKCVVPDEYINSNCKL